jgi:hypothetical protein
MATIHAAPLRLRIATFNVSLNREQPGALAADLRSGTNAQPAKGPTRHRPVERVR